MLVLSRRPDEKILLPTVPVLIKVISANAGLARLGFEAPADVPILREELTRDAAGTPEVVGEDAQPLRERVGRLTKAMTRLRLQLTDSEPSIRETLARLEEEVQALRRATRGPRREKVGV